MNLLTSTIGQRILDSLQELCESQDSTKAKVLLIRSLLEELYKELTIDARVSANGLFACMQYLHDQIKLPTQLVTQANLLRIFGNTTAHERNFEPDEKSLLSALKVMLALLRFYCEELDFTTLQEYLASQNATFFEDRPHSIRRDIICVVHDWKLIKTDGQHSGIEITAIDEEGSAVFIMLRNGKDKGEGTKWSLLSRCLWKWATLNCLNLSEATGPANHYLDNPGTLIVLEPDYLMDISSIADCISSKGMHPELAAISRIIFEGSTQSLVLGSAVNNVFDDLMTDPEADYDELFRKSLDRAPIPLVALGKASALQIHHSIRDEHYPRLKDMARYASKLEMMLEPSFISPRYGLQGRLDLLYIQNGKYYIVELKSGSAPSFGVWPNHQAQVIGYNMLIRECFGASSLGTSSILYSRLPEKSLIHVSNTVKQEQTLIMCRNRILGIFKLLSDNPRLFFDWLKGYDGEDLASYAKDKLKEIQGILARLDEVEYQWYLQQIRLAIKETWYAKIGSGGGKSETNYGYSALWQQSSLEKLRRYKIVTALKLESTDKNILTFTITEKDRISDFRIGDVVVAYREDLPVFRQEILRCELIDLNESSIKMRARGVLNPAMLLKEDQLWAIEHDLLESMLFSPLASITAFLGASSSKRNKLIGIEEPEFAPVSDNSQDDIDRIISQIDGAKDYCVVQGPPGTGKTSGLITRFVKKLFLETEQTVLVLSFTNRAVDEICFNLDRHQIPYIRTGRSQSVEEQLMGNLIKGRRFDEIEKILKGNRIWVATVQSCNVWIDDFTRIKDQIGTLVIDEASQIIEPVILGIMAKAQRTILVGDQNQLPPIISQPDSRYNYDHEKLKSLCYSSYNRSMMERLFLLCEQKGWKQGYHTLQTQYRMHQDIASTVQHYYKNQLVCANPSQKEELQTAQTHELLDKRVIWIDCPPAQKAYYDHHQCEVVLRLLQILQESGEIKDLERDIGIVAPFRAMIQALRQRLGKAFDEITIDTVERFQGSERDIVIYTMPLRFKSELKNMEAISDDQRVDRKLNVALSRARRRLIILGNSSVCISSPHYFFLMDKIRSSHKMIPSTRIVPVTSSKS